MVESLVYSSQALYWLNHSVPNSNAGACQAVNDSSQLASVACHCCSQEENVRGEEFVTDMYGVAAYDPPYRPFNRWVLQCFACELCLFPLLPLVRTA
jgi:hypothetical protein